MVPAGRLQSVQRFALRRIVAAIAHQSGHLLGFARGAGKVAVDLLLLLLLLRLRLDVLLLAFALDTPLDLLSGQLLTAGRHKRRGPMRSEHFFGSDLSADI